MKRVLTQSPLLRGDLGVCFAACRIVGQDPCDPDNMRQVPRNLTYRTRPSTPLKVKFEVPPV